MFHLDIIVASSHELLLSRYFLRWGGCRISRRRFLARRIFLVMLLHVRLTMSLGLISCLFGDACDSAPLRSTR